MKRRNEKEIRTLYIMKGENRKKVRWERERKVINVKIKGGEENEKMISEIRSTKGIC